MSPFSPRFEKHFSQEIRRRASELLASTLGWRRTVRRWLGPVTTRILWGTLMAGALLFLGAILIGGREEFRKTTAAFAGIVWMAGRGLWLATTFLSQIKFSTRSRALLALPADESGVITATVGYLRWQPLVILLECFVLIGLGFLLMGSREEFPVSKWLGGASAAFFATLGVTGWSILLSSRFGWKLPGGSFLESRRPRSMVIWALLIFAMFGHYIDPQLIAPQLAEFFEPLYVQLHLIPLLGWTVRWFDPIPGQPPAGAFFAATVIVSLLPLLFAGRGLKKGAAYLSRFAPALLATHWRGAEISPPPSVSPAKKELVAEPQAPSTFLKKAAAEPGAPRFLFIENFAREWFTGDERRAMTVHLGSPYPRWTLRAMTGSGGLLAVVAISAIARAFESSLLQVLATGSTFVLGIFSLFLMIGGASPSRGLRVMPLGSFCAPRFAGWPIRVKDLIGADWKTAVIRNVTALPVSVSAAFSLGWLLGGGTPAGAKAAVNLILLLIVVTACSPLSLLSGLANSTKRPSFFSPVFWLMAAIGLPLVLLIVLLVGAGFALVNTDKPGLQLAGILAGAAVFLPVLGSVWLHCALHNRVRIALETLPSGTSRE